VFPAQVRTLGQRENRVQGRAEQSAGPGAPRSRGERYGFGGNFFIAFRTAFSIGL
jgi:hypothetical protein